MSTDWKPPYYECEHGIKGSMDFVHIVRPMTTADGSLPVPPCNPELVSS